MTAHDVISQAAFDTSIIVHQTDCEDVTFKPKLKIHSAPKQLE